MGCAYRRGKGTGCWGTATRRGLPARQLKTAACRPVPLRWLLSLSCLVFESPLHDPILIADNDGNASMNGKALDRRKFIQLTAMAAVSLGLQTQRAAWGVEQGAPDTRDLFLSSVIDGDLVLLAREQGDLTPLTPTGVDSLQPASIPGRAELAFVQFTEAAGRVLVRSRGGETSEFGADALQSLNVRYPAPSPLGAALAVSVDGDLYVVQPLDGSPVIRRITHGVEYDISPTWSPDESSIAFTRLTVADLVTGSQSSDIFRFDLGSGELQQLTGSGRAADPRWSPSGKWISWDDQREVHVITPEGVPAPMVGTGGLGSTWSGDGSRLAYGRDDSLVVLDVSSAEEVVVARGLPGEVHSPAWDPYSDRIAYLVSVDGIGSAAWETNIALGHTHLVRDSIARDVNYSTSAS